MPAVDSFFDTNVVLYALSSEAAKKHRVADLLSRGGVLSTQVLAESANVMRRKWGRSIEEIRDFHDDITAACRVRLIGRDTVGLALRVAERYGFSIYDSLIVAAALEAGCATLYSEDMQDGQLIEGRLRVVNPFR